MIDADGKRTCDKEFWSKKRKSWRACNKLATVNVKSEWISSGLDYCAKHAPNPALKQEPKSEAA